MNFLKRFEDRFLYDTFGAIATASMLVCLISGVFLAIPFDVSSPYDSISYFLLTSPGAVLFRNLHYWSAQGFLIFTILHFWDHLFRSTELQVKKGVWLRLVFSIFFIFYVMLSGFILKGDADSMQARRIFDSLLSQVPLIGELLAFSFLGKPDSFQLIYVHHIASASIFLVIIIVEHAKSLWTRVSTLIITSLIILIFSYLFQAPLHDNLQNLVKGPWYFLGLQEILHWTSRPVILLLALLVLFFILYWVKGMKPLQVKISKSIMLGFFVLYLGLTLVGYFFRGENWAWTWNVKEAYFPFKPDPIKPGEYFDLADSVQVLQVLGRREGCVSCHGDVAGLSVSHDPLAIGCSSCHLGNPFTPDKDQAHYAMILIPGNLKQATLSCGSVNCHPEISSRIQSSMMSTLSGIVSVDRFVFGESEHVSVLSDIREIAHTPADEHLRNLCAHCHLEKEKLEFGAIDQLSRGGGCNACHLNYSEEALKILHAYTGSLVKDTFLIHSHPSLDIRISNDHCFGCHSRSGRISTSYEGWHETLLEVENIKEKSGYRVLQDQRVFEYVRADVHHEADMECIDCHNSYELMGDGNLYMHKEEAVSIQCEDCHFHNTPKRIALHALDVESQKIIGLRSFDTLGQYFQTTRKNHYPLLNVFISSSGNNALLLKNSGKILALNPPRAVCTSTLAHADLTCESCHTAWAPQCIGCHNEYDQHQQGYDLLADQKRQGSWVEYVGQFLAEKPTLGVRYDPEDPNAHSKSIITVTPGMVMSIDVGSFDKDNETLLFHRLFAPISAHTTSIESRSCKSCHNDPLALGYGRGDLVYTIENGIGSWIFTPQYAANEHDGLPEDAWIAFLSGSKSPASTRDDIRPFSLEEQRKILMVGACLSCHSKDDIVMEQGLIDFQKVMDRRTEACILPSW